METTEDPNENLPLKRAAEKRELKFATLYQWCYDGKIPSSRNGDGQRAGYLVKLADIDRYLADPRGARTALNVQAGGGQGRRPRKADAEKRPGESERSTPAPVPAAESTSPNVPAKRKRKTAVRMSKDFMRKCSVPEMLRISTWLLHRVHSRLGEGRVPQLENAPVEVTAATPATK